MFWILMKSRITLTDIKNEIVTIRKKYPAFKDDSAFVFWFLSSYLVENEEIAKSSLTGKEGGRGGEKNIDGIFIDEKQKQCNIIQGKFHSTEGYREKRNDILTFAELGLLPWKNKTIKESFYSELDPIVLEKIKELEHCVKTRKYKLNLYYVTTGLCTNTIIKEAESRVNEAEGSVEIIIITEKQILGIFEKCYLEGIAPANLPQFKLKILSEGMIQHEGVIHRYDPKTQIESWVFSASGNDIGNMFAKAGNRLFAKNIRGYLGSTEINESISETINKEPNNFWYYNNGVTIVCDDAKRETQGGEDVIIVDGAQVINGQQTTRTLNDNDSADTNLLIKIIKIPKDLENNGDYDRLVNSIVKATNWQNYISPSDLVSNDYIQVYLEREFRKVGYQYIRKKMSKSEARRWFGQGYFQIDKREIAQAVASCLFDPVVVRKGREGLFEDRYYKYIFGQKQLSFYLSKYWLMRQVQYAARGHPEQAYAKWLVLNFLWERIGVDIGSGYSEKSFRYECEHYYSSDVLDPLNKAITNVFRAALKYWRLNRGDGEEAKDVSSFFLLTNHHNNMKRFWESSKNPYRRQFTDHVAKFKKELEKVEIED